MCISISWAVIKNGDNLASKPEVLIQEGGYGGGRIEEAVILSWHPTLVLLPGKSHGRRSRVGCSPWGL